MKIVKREYDLPISKQNLIDNYTIFELRDIVKNFNVPGSHLNTKEQCANCILLKTLNLPLETLEDLNKINISNSKKVLDNVDLMFVYNNMNPKLDKKFYVEVDSTSPKSQIVHEQFINATDVRFTNYMYISIKVKSTSVQLGRFFVNLICEELHKIDEQTNSCYKQLFAEELDITNGVYSDTIFFNKYGQNEEAQYNYVKSLLSIAKVNAQNKLKKYWENYLQSKRNSI